jgi:hypothetical protein
MFWISGTDYQNPSMGQLTVKPPPSTFVVQYEAYIPVDHVLGPLSYCYFNILNPPVQLIYKGDGPSGASYRAMESVTAVPDAGFSFPPSSATGQTRNYGYGSPANGSTLSSLDEDGIALDCYLWNNAGQSTQTWTPTVTYPSAHKAVINFSGTANNPLVLQIGGIQWSMLVGLDTSNPAAPTATVNYLHTCYPAHQVSVNGVVVYSFVPTDNSPDNILFCLAAGLGLGSIGPGQVTVPLGQ